MKIYKKIDELIGKTPLMELSNIKKEHKFSARLLAKLEYFNPAGSIKDRVAMFMLNDAEEKGLIKSGSIIIEPTSGNTGIGLAAIGTARGYRVILTMPETMSIERRNLLKAYGAEIILTDGSLGMNGAIDKAKQLVSENSNYFMPSQFENMSNPKAHIKTTGPEIWKDTDGKVDIVVAGVGTGGTISGIGKYLKAKNPNIKIVAVEPYNSAVLSGESAGAHGLQGIGAGFIPNTLNTEIYDEIIKVKEDDAYKTGKELATKEGLLVGITSGASVYAAMKVARRKGNENKMIVAILPDTGERYMSTPMFE